MQQVGGISFLRQLTTWHYPHAAAARCCSAAAADRRFADQRCSSKKEVGDASKRDLDKGILTI